MSSSFDTRLTKLENHAPVVANDDRSSPFPTIQAFIEDHGGRQDNESYANAAARILDISSADLTEYLQARALGER